MRQVTNSFCFNVDYVVAMCLLELYVILLEVYKYYLETISSDLKLNTPNYFIRVAEEI